MTDARVTVIIVTHDSEAVVEAALESIPSGLPVICIDNASCDRTYEIVSRHQVKMVRNENVGYGSACNIGAEIADTEFVFFLNPDASIEVDTIDRLLEAASRYSDAAILSPRIENDLGRIQFRDITRIEQWRASRRAPKSAAPVGDCCTGFADGSIFLARNAIFRECGGFDPNIFLYHEDDDLSHRLQARGYSLVHVHDARAKHNASTSSSPTAGNLIRRGHARKASEYYVKTKYGLPASRLLDGVRQLIGVLWYGLTLNKNSLWNSLGKLKGVAGFRVALPTRSQANDP